MISPSHPVALITGGGTGIGLATATRLVQAGYRVAITYLPQTEAVTQQAAAEIAKLGGDTLAVACDITHDDQCRRAVETVTARWGALHALVNNAGLTRFIPHSDLERVTDEDWHSILDVNVLGTFHMARAAFAAIDRCGGGSIINLASIAGIQASGSSIPYGISKAAVISLTVALARVMGPRVRVNAVAPGFVEGDWMQRGLSDRYETAKQQFERAVPLQRACRPDDIAAAIVSLITGSSLVTGHTLVCDAGAIITDAVLQGVRQ